MFRFTEVLGDLVEFAGIGGIVNIVTTVDHFLLHGRKNFAKGHGHGCRADGTDGLLPDRGTGSPDAKAVQIFRFPNRLVGNHAAESLDPVKR